MTRSARRAGGDRGRHGRRPRLRSERIARGTCVQPARGGPTPVEEAVAIPERMLRPGGALCRGGAAARRQRARAERLVAVDGWLTVAPDEPGCTDLPVVACPRRGDLSGNATARRPDAAGGRTRLGTPLLGLTRQSPSLGTWTVPNRVALVGHVRATKAGPVFTIGRLGGCARRRGSVRCRRLPLVTTPLVTRGGGAGSTRVRGGRRLDVADGARWAMLARFDAVAADAIGAAGGPVWYLRTMVWQPLGRASMIAGRRLRLVVDDRTR